MNNNNSITEEKEEEVSCEACAQYRPKISPPLLDYPTRSVDKSIQSDYFSDAWADRLNVIPNNTESVALGAITVRTREFPSKR